MKAVWAGLAALIAFDAIGVVWQGWTVVWTPVAVLAVAAVVLLGLAALYRTRGPSVARFAAGMAFLLLAAPVCVVAVYVVTRFGFPLRDHELAALDAALGFHWTPVAQWVYSHDGVARTLAATYALLMPQSALVVAVLALQRPDDLTPYLRAYLLAFVVTVAVWAVLPAAGAYPEGPSAVATLAIRDGTLHTLDIRSLVGIVSMPSFHAAGAVLMALACWPIPWLRWPMVTLDAVMVVATVPMGAHYAVDVIAGTVLAVWSAQRMGMPALQRGQWERSSTIRPLATISASESATAPSRNQ